MAQWGGPLLSSEGCTVQRPAWLGAGTCHAGVVPGCVNNIEPFLLVPWCLSQATLCEGDRHLLAASVELSREVCVQST